MATKHYHTHQGQAMAHWVEKEEVESLTESLEKQDTSTVANAIQVIMTMGSDDPATFEGARLST